MNPLIIQLVIFAVSTLAMVLLAPKPPKAKPKVMDASDFPIAEEGTPIIVAIGKVKLTNPNMVWFGDLDRDEVKTKQGK